MKKTLLLLALSFFFAASVCATEFTGTVSVPKFSLSGTLTSDADTTFTVNLNGGSQTGIAVFTQTVANASPTTPSLASGTLTGGGSTTFTLTVDTVVTTDTTWSGFISYGDGETTGPITINATAADETPPDFSVDSPIIPGTGSMQVVRIIWESDDNGDTTGTITLPPGLIRSVRFFSSITPTNLYDVTLKDASGFDCLVGDGGNVTSAATLTKNPVLNSTFAVGVSGSYQLLIVSAGADKSGVIEIMIGD